jgi:hypothetical protein
LLDKDQQRLLTVHSEDKATDTSVINNIYIISQLIFTEVSRKNVRGTPQRVNQPTGFYFHRALIKHLDQYILVWEGDKFFISD